MVDFDSERSSERKPTTALIRMELGAIAMGDSLLTPAQRDIAAAAARRLEELEEQVRTLKSQLPSAEEE